MVISRFFTFLLFWRSKQQDFWFTKYVTNLGCRSFYNVCFERCFLYFQPKGNPNLQGLLDWILQILHHYYRKRHKKVKTHGLLNKSCSLFALLSVCCDLSFLPPSSTAEFFHFLNTVLREFETSQLIIRAIYSFDFWSENDFPQAWPAGYRGLHKKLCLQ